jgi:hypothetical protein
VRRFLLLLLCVSAPAFGNAIVITDPTVIQSYDMINWSQFGSDMSTPMSLSGHTSVYEQFTGQLGSGHATIVVACNSSAYCDWQSGNGINSGDTLVKTPDTASADPLSITLSRPMYGVGGYIQADSGTQFTARIQAFAGVNSVLDMLVTSDAAGDPLYLGALDNSKEITRVVYSLNGAGGFALDTLYFQTYFINNPGFIVNPPTPIQQPPLAPAVAAPEPSAAALLFLGMLIVGLKLKTRFATA